VIRIVLLGLALQMAAGGAMPQTAPARPSCQVTLNASRVSVPARGQTLDVRTENVPPGCSPAVAIRSQWLQSSASGQPDIIRLLVTPNQSREARATTVLIADKVLTIEQAASEPPPVSVVPGRLTFGLHPKKAPEARRIAIQAEDPNATVVVTSTADWLSATPVKGRTREYDVKINPAKIPPGRSNEAAVHVSAGAAAADVIVVVERAEVW
jgi:hypothetical protein